MICKLEIIVAIMCLVSFGAGLLLRPVSWTTPDAEWIPSPKELQEVIGVEPDGIIGPRTLAAWEKYYCNQCGIAVCESTGMKEVND